MNGPVGESPHYQAKMKSNSEYSLLSDKRILEHKKLGNVIISPFKEENLGTASYDVSLGEYYYREQSENPGQVIYSLWCEEDTRRVWGKPQKAVNASEYMKSVGLRLNSTANSHQFMFVIY